MNDTNSIPTSPSRKKTQELTLTGVMTALLCILGPLSIPLPFSPVPISFTNLAVFLSVYTLGMRRGTVSYLIYLLIGIAGLPVFSGFAGGLGKVAGPTGGYLVGFFFLALIEGWFVEKGKGKPAAAIAGMVLGMAVCYAFGTAWLSRQLGISFYAGLGIGVLPYLPGDILKMIATLAIGVPLRGAVRRLS